MPGNWGYLTNDIKAFVDNNIPKRPFYQQDGRSGDMGAIHQRIPVA